MEKTIARNGLRRPGRPGRPENRRSRTNEHRGARRGKRPLEELRSSEKKPASSGGRRKEKTKEVRRGRDGENRFGRIAYRESFPEFDTLKRGEKRPAREKRFDKQKKPDKLENLKIIPIGGMNEIGKNMTAIEYRDQILIIDCGMSFPEDDMYGIDVVIPDFTYVVENAQKVVGVVVTHAHEDHIGAIPYLLKKIDVPVYATRITLGLIENKLKEHGITARLHPITAGDVLHLGRFKIETIRTTHSVADAICLYIVTPAATLFHTGDFKIDYTPIDGDPVDLQKFAEIGRRGVDIMLADSTNALRKGFTKSESFVGDVLDKFFATAKGRIIIATFSSNVHRVQTIINLAAKYKRKFSVSGRSMENVVGIAQELGYLKIPHGAFIPLDQMNAIPNNKMVLITTGSQGEPMSALARMANDEHRNVKLRKGDMVILSSTPVPGNEKSVSEVVNKLYRKGIDVIYNEIADIHVSGHACQEELKLIHSLIRPHFFMPVHGESRHLIEHAKLAENLGLPRERIFMLSNGDRLTVDKHRAFITEQVTEATDILVDGLGIGDVGDVVLNDRKLLSTSGLIIIAATIDRRERELLAGPEIVSRGFVYVKEHEELIEKTRDVAEKAIWKALRSGNVDWNDLKSTVRSEVRKFIFAGTHRSPLIMPIFLEL